MRRMFPVIMALLVLLGIGFALKLYRDMGGFKTILPDELEDCRPVLGVLSSEDITIDPENGFAFVSGDDRRGQTGKRYPGSVYGYSLMSPQIQPKDLTASLEMEFHPHGLSLYRGPEEPRLLFVINHRLEQDSIEIFEVRESTLVHRETITGDLLHDANDIVAVGARSFYVTRDHGYSSGWGRFLEEHLSLKKSSIVFYDGQSFGVVAKGLAYANGINVSPDGLVLYVAATLEGKIRVYSRGLEDGTLTLKDEIVLNTAIDNIEVDEAGMLWIGAHPKLLDFLEYSRDPKVLSPSQVLRVSVQDDGNYDVEQIYLSDGRYLSGSSVAARWRSYLMIGSVFDRRFLVCRLEEDRESDASEIRVREETK